MLRFGFIVIVIATADGRRRGNGRRRQDGERVSQQRIDGVFSASAVAADGKIFLVSETGETIVMQSGRTPRVMARNDLGERAMASPAISSGQIFLCTDEHLYCIGTGH